MTYLRYHDKIRALLLILFLIGVWIPVDARAADMPSQNIQKTVQNQIPPAGTSLKPLNIPSSLEIQTYTEIQKAILNHLKAGNGFIKSAKGVVPLRERFYSERQFQPAWIRDKMISDQVQKLIQILKEAERR